MNRTSYEKLLAFQYEYVGRLFLTLSYKFNSTISILIAYNQNQLGEM